MMPRATSKETDDLLVHYPDKLKAGCPFDTGIKNALGKPSLVKEREADLYGNQ